MYLNFVNDQHVGKPQQLPNCYECISNFDCLEKNDPEALKDLSKYGVPNHKWLKAIDVSDPLDCSKYQKYDCENFEYFVIDNIVYFKNKITTPLKEEILSKIREERNKILASTDWTQLPDVFLTENDKNRYLKYRKELRDFPNKYLQTGEINWPSL